MLGVEWCYGEWVGGFVCEQATGCILRTKAAGGLMHMSCIFVSFLPLWCFPAGNVYVPGCLPSGCSAGTASAGFHKLSKWFILCFFFFKSFIC